jgi:hypothetical protein
VLMAQREEEKLAEDEVGGRVFARPKGRSGRFSDVHMAEFKKMDSIANHPSAFRAQQPLVQPVSSLKRSPSKPNFNEPESTPMGGRAGIKRTQSKANLNDQELAPTSMRASLKRSQSRPNLKEPEPTPMSVRAGIKRSQSKPNLKEPEATPISLRTGIPRSQSKANLKEPEPTSMSVRAGMKRTQSKANLKEQDPAPMSVRAGIKRTQSKANLNDQEPASMSVRGLKHSQSKIDLQDSQANALSRGWIKRTQSKANLHEAEPASHAVKTINNMAYTTTTTTTTVPTVFTSAPKNVKDNEMPSWAKRARQTIKDDATTNRPVSRDGSLLPRPKSSGQDSVVAGGIPRTKSLASLMSPTKSSLAHAAGAKSQVPVSLTRSPSKATLGSLRHSPSKTSLGGGSLRRSSTVGNLYSQAKKAELEQDEAAEELPVVELPPSVLQVRSPSGRLDKVKALLRGGYRKSAVASPDKAKSAIPLPSTLNVPRTLPSSFASLDKELPPVPPATPSRKLVKRVAFTPDTTRTVLAENSPSPVKSGIPQLKLAPAGGEVYYPTLDTVMTDSDGSDDEDAEDGADDRDNDVSYPDLSPHRPLPEPPVAAEHQVKHFKASTFVEPGTASTSGPNNFTFRANQTIRFGGLPSNKSAGFGTSPGQASVRVVRSSIMPSMPGSFPASTFESVQEPVSNTSPNKENMVPRPEDLALAMDFLKKDVSVPTPVLTGLSHGLANKKRHRVSTDEDDVEREANERAAKKRRQESVPEGEVLLAPRLAHSARRPIATPSRLRAGGGFASASKLASSSPLKKKSGISLSRLNMLARPKLRK